MQSRHHRRRSRVFFQQAVGVLGLLSAFSAGAVDISPPGLRAPAPRAPHTLWFSAAYDSDATQDYILEFDYGLGAGQMILGVGETVFSQDLGGFDSQNFKIGFGSDPTLPGGVSLTFDTWGQSQELVTNSLNLAIFSSHEQWRYSISAMAREIDVYVLNTSGGTDRETLWSSTLGGAIGYYNQSGVELTLEMRVTNWPADTSVLSAGSAAGVLSRNALTLSSGFLEKLRTVEIAYNFPNSRLAVFDTEVISIVDGSHSQTLAMKATLYAWNMLSMHLEGGRTTTGVDFTSGYAQLGVGMSW